MKKIYSLVLATMVCCQDSITPPSLNSIDYRDYSKFLSFKDFEEFDSVTYTLAQQEYASILKWETENKITSLRSILEESIVADELHLQEALVKYGESSEVGRDVVGWSELTEKYIDEGYIFIDQDGLQDANVTIPRYASVVNPHGIVKIGSFLYQFKRDEIVYANYVSSIHDVVVLKELPDANKSEVERHVNSVPDNSMRSMVEFPSNKKCESVKDKYRLIAYEEYITTTINGFPCTTYIRDYYLKLRSLKKVLGTWQNHETGSLGSSGNYHAVHYLACPSTDQFPILRTFKEQGYNKTCPYGHTCALYFIEAYPTGICTTPTCDPPDPAQYDQMFWYERMHYPRGKNGTNCYVGQ